MANNVLRDILSQYNKKKCNAELEAEQRKQELYKKHPKLQQIDDKLTALAISTAKSLINNNNQELLQDLDRKISELKKEKEIFLNNINISEDYFSPK